MPLSWVIYALLVALLTKKPKHRKIALVSGLGFLFFFGNGFIYNEVIRLWEVPPTSPQALSVPYDVVVVLTGGIAEVTSPAPKITHFGFTSDRIWQAVALYRQQKVKKILISGGIASVTGVLVGEEEGTAIRDYLVMLGLPKEDILLENQSRNTHENALFSAKILKNQFPKGQFLLCTSASHLRRSMACFRKVGILMTPYPAEFRMKPRAVGLDSWYPREMIFFQWQLLLREWIGFVVYKVMGYC